MPASAGNGGSVLNTLLMMKLTSKAGVTFMPSVELMSHHEPTPRMFCEVEVFWLLKFAGPMKMSLAALYLEMSPYKIYLQGRSQRSNKSVENCRESPRK